MIVKETETAQGKGDVFVAADMVGAGVGEDVLVVTGSTARRAAGKEGVPVDLSLIHIWNRELYQPVTGLSQSGAMLCGRKIWIMKTDDLKTNH